MTQRRTKANEIAMQKAAARQRSTLTRGSFLQAQGPGVVEVALPMLGHTAMMRRVDVLALVRSGSVSEPIQARVTELVKNAGVTDEMVSPAAIDETIEMAAALTRSCIVVPPAAYLEGSIDAAQISHAQARELKPLFVGPDEEPDADQVVLDWITPEEDDDPEVDVDAELARGRLHYRDLTHVATCAYLYGPGGLGRVFRGQGEALATVEPVADGQGPAKPADGDRLPVGGARPRRGGGGAGSARPGRVRGGARPAARGKQGAHVE